ncbi:TcpQ domain-containing protein [Paracidovorax wautersii]|nr:TcpQ domain-containing protein [Paracidovorax wautersii]
MAGTQTIERSWFVGATSLQWGAPVFAILALALTGCSTPAPKDYGGSWMPVNRFQSAPTEIPLSPAYTFYASPMDATLRNMLTRWASDNGLQLVYQIGSDFTLHQPVARVRSNDIQTAVSELSAIYAPQGIVIVADSKRIAVQPAASAAPTAVGLP